MILFYSKSQQSCQNKIQDLSDQSKAASHQKPLSQSDLSDWIWESGEESLDCSGPESCPCDSGSLSGLIGDDGGVGLALVFGFRFFAGFLTALSAEADRFCFLVESFFPTDESVLE